MSIRLATTAAFAATIVALAAQASTLPRSVSVRIGARLDLGEIRIEYPDGSLARAGIADEETFHLPPGTRLTLEEGDVRHYRGTLRLRSGEGGVEAWLDVPLEAYLAGVVASEIGTNAPRGALEAQAIVSRTLIALGRDRHPEGPWDLCDLTHCQSFRGIPEGEAVLEAVRATRGQVLAVDGLPVEAPFHSTCGGGTLPSQEVWGTSEPHLRGVDDTRPDGTPWCSSSPHGEWTAAVAADGLPDPAAEPDRFRTEVGRRHGWNLVKSNRFTATPLQWKGRTLWLVQGSGLGHGVGLCQHGAIARARGGATAMEILAAYYPGAEVITLPQEAP